MSKRPGALIRVMIVEDDPETLERFAGALSRDPRTRVVENARTGSEAIARLSSARPDVLLVDLGLPDMHGTRVISHAIREHPACDVMVITVFGDERNVLASIEAGATAYVLKDCADDELIAKVLELRTGGAPMSPGIARLVLNRIHRQGRSRSKERAGPDGRAILTKREVDVLNLIARGYLYTEIGGRLGISVNTVTSHIKNSYRKLAVHSGAAAVTRAAQLGLLRSDDDKGKAR